MTETLYLKYRPQSFEEVVGQEEVVNFLKKSIQEGKIAHSYLFYGDRGTGKTSVARILAKELGVSKDDILEIDAASNRGIGEIREIRDSVDILPINSPYKVYIIDEVHMLTKEAFNALLKTLEEPPKHIIFILATTEKEKILPTIISRCQVLNFKNPDKEDLLKVLKRVVKEEKREVDEKVLEEVVKEAKGSYRDALTILQKILMSFEDPIKIEEYNKKIKGENFDNLVLDFLFALKDEEKKKDFLLKIRYKNLDYLKLVDLALKKIRENIYLKLEGKKEEEDLKFNSQDILNLIDLYQNLKKSDFPELLLEVYLLKNK